MLDTALDRYAISIGTYTPPAPAAAAPPPAETAEAPEVWITAWETPDWCKPPPRNRLDLQDPDGEARPDGYAAHTESLKDWITSGDTPDTPRLPAKLRAAAALSSDPPCSAAALQRVNLDSLSDHDLKVLPRYYHAKTWDHRSPPRPPWPDPHPTASSHNVTSAAYSAAQRRSEHNTAHDLKLAQRRLKRRIQLYERQLARELDEDRKAGLAPL